LEIPAIDPILPGNDERLLSEPPIQLGSEKV
jgi:hypothetical protein